MNLIHTHIKSVDYIVVGHGLAGSALALRLWQQGKSFVVFDQPGANRASSVAAGLFNPVSGKWLAKSWMAEKIFPELHQFYTSAEKILNARFFYPQPLYRPFISIEEQNEWMGRSAGRALKNYVKEIITQSKYGKEVHDPFGGIVQADGGYVDVQTFLLHVQQLLISIQAFVPERLDETLLEVTDRAVRYKNIDAGKIIFCNGTGVSQSAMLKDVPILLLKGETITIEAEQPLELIYQRGVYIVPMPEKNRYKVGATYELKLLTSNITEAARKELVEKLNSLLKVPYRVIGQDWGFRPTTIDRKPILGQHSISNNVIIFNGLGTKGVSLAPYFSGQLLDWLTKKNELHPEVNINRFKSLFSKSIKEV